MLLLHLTAGLKACNLGMKPSLSGATLSMYMRMCLLPLLHRLALLLLMLYYSCPLSFTV